MRALVVVVVMVMAAVVMSGLDGLAIADGTRAPNLTAAAESQAAARADRVGPLVGVIGPLPVEAHAQVNEVERLKMDRDYNGAATALAPLLATYPNHVRVHLLSCEIEMVRGGPTAAAATAACDRAIELSDRVETRIDVARTHRSNGDPAGARARLVAAEAWVATLPAAKVPAAKVSAAWLELADHYRNIEALTWAEDALAKANVGTRDNGIASWAATLRVRFGLPRDGARYRLVPDDDIAVLIAVRDVIARTNGKEFAAAARVADAADKRWPGLPGLLAARCHLALRRGQLAAARQLCERSLREFESSWAVYASGAIELRATKTVSPATIATLRKAIALDPALVDAWNALADALDRSGEITELDQLRFGYRAQFHKRAPW